MMKSLSVIFFTIVLMFGFSTVLYASERTQSDELECFALRIVSSIMDSMETVFDGEIQLQLVFHMEDGTRRESEFFLYATECELKDVDVIGTSFIARSSYRLWVTHSMNWLEGRPLPTHMQASGTARQVVTGNIIHFSGLIPRTFYRRLTTDVYYLSFAGYIYNV